jgi:hypothetical protein
MGGGSEMNCQFGALPHGPRNRIARVTDEDARRFLWERVQDVPVTYGSGGDDWRPWGPTMLEDVSGRDVMAGVAQSREVLRGYPWVTVCGPEIAARLGGPDALRASGAFHEVRVLPTGSVWLQATERLGDYTGDALRRSASHPSRGYRAYGPLPPTLEHSPIRWRSPI